MTTASRLGSLAQTVPTLALGALAIPNAALAAHLCVLTGAALVTPAPRRGETADDADLPTCHVLVPAHDEASVIAATIGALVAQSYPPDRYGVHVVADNCTDATAALARAAGATVHERTAPDDPGKGPALNWLLERIGGGPDDVVVVVDADTVAEPGFARAIASEVLAGAHAVQGSYGVLDAEASSATSLRWAALAVRHHLRPLGRARLGWSCGLFGNGMAFRRSVLVEHPWTGHLTEDAEMALRLLDDGIAVRYRPDAVVRAEMPTSLEGSESQHQRWELGRAQTARTFVPRLLRRAVGPRRGGDEPSRAALVDATLDQLLPPLSMLLAAQSALLVAAVPVRTPGGHRLRVVSAAAVAVSVGHVMVGLRVARAPSWVWRSLLSAPRMVAWKLALLAGMSTGSRRTTWVRTPRNDA